MRRPFLACLLASGLGACAAGGLPGIRAQVSVENCDARRLARGTTEAPRARARQVDRRVELLLEHYNVGVCGPVDVRAVLTGNVIEFVDYRTDGGSCVSYCDVRISAELPLPPGRYAVRHRRGKLWWIMLDVPPVPLTIGGGSGQPPMQ